MALSDDCNIAQGGHNKCNHLKSWIGVRFNNLVVKKIIRHNKEYRWIMTCDCGNVTHPIRPGKIKAGLTKACGCTRGRYLREKKLASQKLP